MYGIVQIGGHQYRATPGDIIDVQKLSSQEGQDVEFSDVLLISGQDVKVGLPTVEGAKIKAKVIAQGRDRKKIVFKRRPGLWKKKKGHRQHYTSLLVTEVEDGSGQSAKIDQDSPAAKKYLT